MERLTVPVTVNFNDVAVEKALMSLVSPLGMNLEISMRTLAFKKKVNADFHELPVLQALSEIADACGLYVRVRGNYVVVKSADEFATIIANNRRKHFLFSLSGNEVGYVELADDESSEILNFSKAA